MKITNLKKFVKGCIVEELETHLSGVKKDAARPANSILIDATVLISDNSLRIETKNGYVELQLTPEQAAQLKSQRHDLEETQRGMSEHRAGVIYKDRQGGTWVYWIWSTDEQRKIHIKPEAINKMLSQGYEVVELQREEEQPEPYDDESGQFAPSPRQRPEDWKAGKDQSNPPSPDKPQISETLSAKGIAVIQKWQNQLKDNRKCAVKLVDYALSRLIGLKSDDLSDTTTFSNGLDMIEQALDDSNYQSAFDIAKDTAREMVEEEGGGEALG